MNPIDNTKDVNYNREVNGFMGHPRPLRPLFFTEFWERFSFYGIRAILVLFMTALIRNGGLGLDAHSAGAIIGIFAGSVYLVALPGGWLADNWLGQRRAIWYGSVLMAFGHLSIALMGIAGTRMFYIGLVLICLGSGLFKTCISVMVGSLYKEGDSRRDAGFSIFYMGINLGAFIAPLLTGWFAARNQWHIGFGIGGLGMLIALIIFRVFAIPYIERYNKILKGDEFWGRPKNYSPLVAPILTGLTLAFIVYVYLLDTGYFTFNPVLVASWLAVLTGVFILVYFFTIMIFGKLTSMERKKLWLCLALLVTAACFWAAFEQQPTSYNLFAEHYTNLVYFGFTVPVGWIQSINSLFVISLAPLFAYIWFALERRNVNFSFTAKFVAALICGALGFTVMLFAALQVISSGASVSLLWIVVSLFLLTCGELLLSPIGLSAMSELAPSSMKSQMMGLWFGGSALGNVIAGLIGGNVHADSINDLPNLFGSVVVALVVCAIILILVAIPINRLIKKG
ncbi:peptide MFS transporter [Bartonella sp. DGB1]|uniref:peptide MFS transporter n=1 Tax=Bartonella sp. DGB1 TaxID=3239807 RepID=UPI00352609E9